MSEFLQLLSVHWRYAVDLSTFAFCIGLLGLYQYRLHQRTRREPVLTVQGMNAQARAAWVERVMTEDRDVMAVQTLRNSTMAATLMASTAVLLIFGILNLLANVDKIGPIFHQLNPWGSQEPGLWIFKLMVLLVDLFIAFFSFALAVRGYHHAGFLVNVPLKRDGHGVTALKVVRVLNRASGYYSIGMRSYYLSVPLVLWLFGPLWLLLSTLALLAILRHLDHLPD